MNTAKCPKCGLQNTVFKQKAQQWECCDCELRFSDIQYEARPQRIFLSYPHAPDKHSQLVEDVAKVIKAKGHTPWFDRNKIKAGYDWRESITKGVLESDWMIIFMSQKSLATGGVCLEEVGIALQKSGHETLLTVLLEDEKTVNPPISLTHVQWLDIKDFEAAYAKDRNNPDDMHKWEQWLDEKFTRLIRHIERKGDITGEITFLRNRLQPSSFVGQIAHSIKGFVGRQWIFDEIRNWQENQRESRTFVIEGAAGIGKSAIAGQLSQQLRDVIGIYFCKHNDATTRDANNLVRTMVFQIASREPAYRSWLQNKLTAPQFDGEKLLVMNAAELVRELIVNAPRINEENKTRLILVIDGLDEARDETGKNAILELVSNEFRKLPFNVGVVITTRPELDIASQMASPHVLSTADPRNIDDITHYLTEQFDSLSVFAEHPDAKTQAVTSAVKKSGGVMLYASELVRSINDKHIDPLAPDNFPDGLSGIYHGYMNREFQSANVFHQTSAALAELIAVSPLPLTEALMRAITGLTKVEFARYIKPLSSLLVTGERDDAVTYALFHKSFADWLVNPNRLNDYRLEGDGLQRIGDFLYACFLEQNQEAECDNREFEWGIMELLPLCLPEMSIWRNIEALNNLGDKLFKHGWYRTAIVPRAQVLVTLNETLGNTHPDTLISMNNTARTLHAHGDLTGARELHERALAIHKATLEDTHPNTLTNIGNLASTLFAQGDLTGARALQEQVLAASKETLGDTHPDTLTCMGNLARTLEALGELTNARALEEQVLSARKSILGENHPHTLTSMNNLASTLFELGDFTSSRTLEEQVLAARKTTLGDTHPHTLVSMGNLANTLQAQGDLVGARALNEQVLAARKAILGENHPHTLTSMNNLANMLQAQGDLESALALRDQVLTAQKETLGDTHPDTLISMGNLASTLKEQGDLTNARRLEEQVLAARKKSLGDTHPDTLTSMNNLANTLKTQGDVAGALALIEQGFSAHKAPLGSPLSDTLTSIRFLAKKLYDQGDFTSARTIEEQVLAIYKSNLGETHPSTLTSMNNLASTLKAQGDLAGARALNEQLLAIHKATLDENHPDTLISMNNLAGTLYAQGDFTSARALEEQVLAIHKATLGDTHPHTLISMNNLAHTLGAQGDLAGARAFHEQVLAVRKATFGYSHPDTLDSLESLANTLFAQEDWAAARALYESALAAYKESLGQNHPDTLLAMHGLAITLRNIGDLNEALDLCRSAYEGRAEVLGIHHSDTLWSKRALATILFKQQKYEEARAIQEETLTAQRAYIGESDSTTIVTMKELADTYDALGRVEDAEVLRATRKRLNEASE